MTNKLSIMYAGQAGFIIQSSSGCRLGIDLYLSDCCERYFGFKRLMPYILNPAELNLNLLLSTHAHYDHFDPDSVPIIMSDKKVHLLAAEDVRIEAERLHLDQKCITYIKVYESFKYNDITIKAMPCDHGTDTPYAIGLLISIDGKKIYVTGDTCYREDYLHSAELENIDVMIMPINGAFGNLNEQEAASAVNIVNPKLAIPCHYWNFAEHGGNPYIFMNEMKEKNNDNYILMRIGEKITI